MASVSISQLGTKYGPCAEACEHGDCAELRKMVGSICGLCNQPIGYESGFSLDPNEPDNKRSYVHDVCLEEATTLPLGAF